MRNTESLNDFARGRSDVNAAARASAEGQGIETLARKAGASLSRHESAVIKEWLKGLIDALGLDSLKSFPTSELSAGIPSLIKGVADSVAVPRETLSGNTEAMKVASLLATVRKEEPTVADVIDDYSALKGLLVAALSRDLRESDIAVLEVSRRLDEGFNEVFKAGIGTFFESHSRMLRHLADTDALTGLHNVRYFRRQLHSNLEMYKRYRMPFSLLMLDLDKLKQLNDVRGHSAGDRALKHLARTLKDEKRETDVAVRYGGDEFFLLLPGTNADEAARLARRIIRKVREINLRTGGEEMTGVSIGVVSCPANGTDVGTLRSRADRALQLAKSIGGNSVAGHGDFNLPYGA
ncbi:MAG: GGDEF domain-containing protein [Gaiellales bacterium]|nr:MAG: GGDEF domain-containing protein [Gaiellales bacterium]